MKRIFIYIAPILLLLIMPLVGCGQPKITVASKLDTEGAILSQIIIQVLRAKGFEVKDKTWMNSTDELRSALINGDIDIYPEYTGNGAKFFEQNLQEPNTWRKEWWEKGSSYTEVNRLEEANRTGVEWLYPAPAANPWAIALNRQVANKYNIQNMQHFADYVDDQNRDKTIWIVGSEEFFTSPVAYPLFEWKYGFSLNEEKGDRKIIVSSSGYAEQLTAAPELINKDILYAAMAYSTDRYLRELNLVVLDDVYNAQPWLNPAPVIRSRILKRYPEIGDILNPIFSELDETTLNTLNLEAGYLEGKLPSDVAREYLEKKGILEQTIELDKLRGDRPDPDSFKAERNERVIEIINTKITVEPQTLWQTDFYVDGSFMNDVRIVGWMMASGGAFNDVKILVLNDIDFTNWKNFHDIKGIYQSDKVTKAQINAQIEDSGSYHLVISNRFSEFSSKDVLLKVYLYYQ